MSEFEICDDHDPCRVIYMGAPMRLCAGCCEISGFWSWVPFAFPIPSEAPSGAPAFKFITYPKGGYLNGLKLFLFGGEEQ